MAAKKQSILSKVRFYKSMRVDLANMQAQALTETEPTRKAKLEKNIGIRTAFLAKLRNGDTSRVNIPATEPATRPTRHSAKPGPVSKTWDWETVETLAGENDFDPW